MQFCKNCGLQLPQGAGVCPQCGAPVPPPPAPEYTAPVYEQAITPEPGTSPADLTLGGYVASLVLFEIPFVGLIVALVWACAAKTPARQKLGAAKLITTAINTLAAVVLCIIVCIVAFVVVGSGSYALPPSYYVW